MSDATHDETGFLALTGKIERERGFRAANYKDKCLRRRIAVRMRARGTLEYSDYCRLLDGDPAEYERLLDALTVNVTKVFRNPDAWAAVEREVLGPLWSRAAPTIQCWVAGCASGEEAYSLAALWHRFAVARGEEHRIGRVRILATDIDKESLAAAERGAYGPDAFVEAPVDIRTRYFSAVPPHTAATALRSLVRFERRDLLEEAPPPATMHLITCRNVIIYFDRASQDALLRRFHDALAPGGFLVLGKVETVLGASRKLFDVVDHRQRIFRRP